MKLKDVCSSIRSKNAGPFWVTFDFFFKDVEIYKAYGQTQALNAQLFESLYGTPHEFFRRFQLDDLGVVKISIPRPSPQGGVEERDMHSGQLCMRLLEIDVS